MAVYYSKPPITCHHSSLFFFFLVITILLTIPTTTYSISFNFSNFPNESDLNLEKDSSVSNNSLDITRDLANQYNSVGRATYSKPITLWGKDLNGSLRVADFTTHFSFTIKTISDTYKYGYGDGMTFFLAPFGSKLPPKSGGGSLGLLSGDVAQVDLPTHQIIAVEFDTYQNPWDPSSDHVGINVNSIISATNVSLAVDALKNGTTANAWVTYDSASQNLSVYLTYADKPLSRGNSILNYIVDLSRYLPENISVGFSASTGTAVELHRIHSWEFNSTDIVEGKDITTDEVPKPITSPTNIAVTNQGRNGETNQGKHSKSGLMVGLVVGLAILGCGLGSAMFIWLKKRSSRKLDDDGAKSSDRDEEFVKEAGPKSFSYRELARATSDFDEGGKLGEGGFGGVYKGFLPGTISMVAVKKISSGSKQGKKEYLSEIRIISRLRHKNLVQLIGWCHERNELLLVYEFMPNRSLDNHLFRGETVLLWEVRYKIAVGLASALMYLHEEWEQCVVHRDIKSSNVMLDSNFNAKLGDFGLARLVDHQQGSQTTVLAGTMGYLAPECIFTGKSNKESDVYSFGIVLLEIACGRRPVEPNKRNLVEWVWELHGAEKIVEAADEKLNMLFDEQQIQRMMVLGLWCAHPDPTTRPSIKQANNLLNYDSPLAKLPSKLPTPVFYTPPMHVCKLAFASACGDITNSQTDGTVCTCSSCSNTNLSQSTMPSAGSSSSESLLRSYQA